MRGRKPLPRNPLSAALVAHRRRRNLPRRWFKARGLGVIETWERSRRLPLNALSDRRVTRLIRLALGITSKDLMEVTLGTATP